MPDNTTTNAPATVSDDSALQRLRELITSIRVAMVTTESEHGALHCRPMYAQQAESDADLWFATSRTSTLVQELRDRTRIVATFADPGDQRYVVVHGAGFVRHDPAKIAELWNPAMKVWFPGGPTDPDLTLIRVEAERAEYWDSPIAPVRWVQFVTALATGTRPRGDSHVRVDLHASGNTGP
jgi:general stress protein 26